MSDNKVLSDLVEIVRKDLSRPVSEWSEADKQDYRDLFGRLPRQSKTD